INFPTHCPECDSLLVRKEGEAIHYCVNDLACPPQVVGRIQHFASRKALDIEGLGDETVETLVREGLIADIVDLYNLSTKREQLLQMDRFGLKSVDNLLEGIEKSKLKPFEKVLFALGIRYVGETVAKKLAQHFVNIENIAAASLEEISEVPEIGERIAESVV